MIALLCHDASAECSDYGAIDEQGFHSHKWLVSPFIKTCVALEARLIPEKVTSLSTRAWAASLLLSSSHIPCLERNSVKAIVMSEKMAFSYRHHEATIEINQCRRHRQNDDRNLEWTTL